MYESAIPQNGAYFKSMQQNGVRSKNQGKWFGNNRVKQEVFTFL